MFIFQVDFASSLFTSHNFSVEKNTSKNNKKFLPKSNFHIVEHLTILQEKFNNFYSQK